MASSSVPAQGALWPATTEGKRDLKRKILDTEEWGTDIATLKVIGKQGTKDFTVHKDLACSHSEVFRAAFDGKFKEGLFRSMDLVDTTKDAVGALVRWMYKDTLKDPQGDFPAAAILVSLWILADKLLIPELQNATIIAIDERRKIDNTVQTALLRRIYENTMEDSPLRRFFIDQTINIRAEVLEKDLKLSGRYTLEMMRDIAIALKKTQSQFHTKRDMANFLVPVPGTEKKT